MLAIPEDARIETKFVAFATESNRLRNWLRLHPAGFYSPFDDRWVNNVYFDTADYHCFDQNISGSSARRKLRYRWYGEKAFPAKGVLEVKCKRNQFGWKQHYKIDRDPYQAGDTWRTFRNTLATELGKEAKLWLDERPSPIIINKYLRNYFVSRDNAVRVTIDTRQQFFDQRYKPVPNTKRASHIPDTMVVELKYDRADRDKATKIIQTIPVRSGRNSKYVIGVRSVFEY